MALNGTVVKIEDIVLEAGQTIIEFTNIPQIYDDLQILISARSTRSAAEDGLGLQLNSITSGYSYRNLTASGTSVASANTNFEQTWAGRIPANSATGSIFSNNLIHLPNYKSNLVKIYNSDSVAENNSSTGYLVMQTTSNTTTSPITSIRLSALNGNLAVGSSATLYGISKTTAQIKATGGTVYDDADYVYHLFASSGTFTPNQALTCDVLVVAGGGGGGSMYVAGGGGAGGLRLLASQALTNAAAYTVTVGGGGAGGNSLGLTVAGKRGSSGSNSSFSGTGITTIITTGGGGGSSTETASTGESATNGGSGGGATRAFPIPGTGNAGSYSPVEGYAGGNDSGAPNYYGGGGGGGSGQVGQNGGATSSGDGGDGTDTYNSISFASWLTATSTGVGGKIAGGGGGGLFVNGGTIGVGGDGGGGRGAGSSAAPNAGKTDAENGVTNTGSGGGGSERFGTGNGGSGGSGIVIVRYAR